MVESGSGPSRGRWAVILGASSGTGSAIARAVARDPGLNVAGFHRGRHPDLAEAVTAGVHAAGRRAAMHVLDAATPEGAAQGADLLHADAGEASVALVVHSLAGASVGRLAVPAEERLSPRQLHRTFDAMAHSFVWWTQALLDRGLLAPSARILGLTNPLDASILRNSGGITASKAALEAYVRHLALELGPLGHRVNLLRFGTVMTPALTHIFDAQALAALEAIHQRMVPAGRMQTVEEVGHLVSLLCSDRAEFFNGATLDFTGGMTQHLLDLVLNRA